MAAALAGVLLLSALRPPNKRGDWDKNVLTSVGVCWAAAAAAAVSKPPGEESGANLEVLGAVVEGGTNGAMAMAVVEMVVYPHDVRSDPTVRVGLDALLHSHDRDDEGSNHSDALERVIGRPDIFAVTLCGSKSPARVGRTPSSSHDDENQDRAFVLRQTVGESKGEDSGDDPFLLQAVGVLDGHGPEGHRVSDSGRQSIVDGLLRRLPPAIDRGGDGSAEGDTDDPAVVSRFLVELVEGADVALPPDAARNGGSTVSFVVQTSSHVYVVNAGDSQSFLLASVVVTIGVDGDSEDGQPPLQQPVIVELYASRKDTPDLPDERQRLEQAGGIVTLESVQDVARVWHGRHGLAMSRGIGDRPALGVISTPRVHETTVQALHDQAREKVCSASNASARSQGAAVGVTGKIDFIVPSEADMIDNSAAFAAACSANATASLRIRLLAVSATDGLLDYLTSAQLAQALVKPDRHPFLGARELLDVAANAWDADMDGSYRDDMALAAFELRL